MKIGILTFHYSINPGSVIQAFCVLNLLKKGFPEAKVEIINLIPANREKVERGFFSTKPPFFRYRKFAKYNSIRKFVNKHLAVSELCDHEDLNKQIEYINEQGYDYIFTGSDTVWMYSEKLGNILPHIYFLPAEIKAKKVSISASVDPLTHESEFLNKKDVLCPLLNDYKKVLVRDSVTYDLLKEIGVEDIDNISDPTFLYDFEKDLKLKTNKSSQLKKKLVLIEVTDDKIVQDITDLLKGHSDQYQFIDRRKSLHIFEDFVIDHINLFSKIDILITDRFHSSIFAMKLSNTLVINVERYNKNPIPRSKGRDLFSRIGIPEYCIRLEKDNQQEFNHKLITLIENWNQSEFSKRENLIGKFINMNKEIWHSTLQHITMEKDKIERV